MGRPFKSGLEYFPLDVDVFDDDKLFDIQNKYGVIGEAVYLRMLCLVYKNGYYYDFKNEDRLAALLIRSVGNRWINDSSEMLEIVRYIVKCGLFSAELFKNNILTSHGIQMRYVKTTERRKKSVDKYSLIKSGDDADNSQKKNTENSSNEVFNGNALNKNECSEDEKAETCTSNPEHRSCNKACKELNGIYADNNSVNVCNNSINADNNSVNVYNKPPKESKEKKSKAKESKVCVLEIPSVNGRYKIFDDYYEYLTHTYTNINIDESLYKLKNYLIANPQCQRRKENLKGYIELWLSEDNKKAGLSKAAKSGIGSAVKKRSVEEGMPATYDISEYESHSVLDSYFD